MGTSKITTRIAVTAGDPFGVGPEVCLAAYEHFKGQKIELTIFGDPVQLAGVDAPHLVAVPIDGEPPHKPGASATGGSASIKALDQALASIDASKHDALVTAPISKESWSLAGGDADGHTPYLGTHFKTQPLMTFVWSPTEPAVALLTTHIPLRAVPATLTSQKVERAVHLLHKELVTRFDKRNPRIAVLGLNPHAGENGLLGTEELDFVAPAIDRLRNEGLSVEGPLPADTAFACRENYDGILALFHDQGLGPVKAIAFERAVNISLGLPVVRTSPCHGTAFGIAGTGSANPASMIAAVEWAARLARR